MKLTYPWECFLNQILQLQNLRYFNICIIIIIVIIIIIIIISIIILLLLLPLILTLLLPSLILLLLLYHYYHYYYFWYSFFIIVTCFFLVREPIRPEGSLGCCELKEQVSTRTYFYKPLIQLSLECLVINWMVNFRYGQ